jgi:hypothetical protein
MAQTEPEDGVGFGRTDRPEAWLALMAGLRVDHDRIRAGKDAGWTDARIADLLAIAVTPGDARRGQYAVANEVELRLAGHAGAAWLSAMATTGLARAEQIGVTGHARLAERIKAAEDAGNVEGLRELVCALLDLTHRRFVDRRAEREARAEVASRLCKWGGGLVALAMVMLGIGFLYSKYQITGVDPRQTFVVQEPTMFDVIGKWHVTTLIYFGVFGAFFSRLIAFQSVAGAMTWDDLHKAYRHRVIAVRLMIGGFAALIFYYFITGNVIGGDPFPHPDTAGNMGPFWVSERVSPGSAPGQHYTLPSANFAKFVVWSFLAGFAERFVPDQLNALEQRARRT